MSVAIKSRLPGVNFQVEPPPLAEVLPRMDIAAFVGLTASGPLHIPVLVEDVARFRDVFGDDLPLAWDSTTGQMQYAHLAPSVEAFFRNGGRRCWVVRVAKRAVETFFRNGGRRRWVVCVAKGAKANRFSLPGLVRADNWRPAMARARCEGSWSDTLRVGTVRVSQTLSVRFQGRAGDYIVDVVAAPSQVQAGDLLQLNFGDKGPLLFLTVDSVEVVPSGQRVRGTGHWFLRRCESSPPPTGASALLLTPKDEQRLPLRSVRLPYEERDLYEIELDLPLEAAPAPGDLLRIDFADGQILLLTVSATAAMPEGSPPGESVRVTGQEGLWPVKEPERLALAEERQPSAERLAFELVVWSGEEIQARFSRLAFSKKHPRFWARLPVDADLFRMFDTRASCPEDKDLVPLSDTRPARSASDTLEAQASEPRFPLAGPEKPATLYLPLGMSVAPDPTTSQGPLDEIDPDTELERDGLIDFSADLFLDPKLAGSGSRALLAEANHKYYMRGEPLLGLHSLLPLEEVTLIVVPDAVHRGWKRDKAPSLAPLPAPTLYPVSRPDDQDTYTLSWSAVTEATAYTLQEATDPTFAQPVTLYEGKETTTCVSDRRDCPRLNYYRVRALRGSEASPWSNTEKAVIPWPDFEDCQVAALEAPELEPISLASPVEDEYIFRWSSVDGATSYTLQEAADAAFNIVTKTYATSHTSFPVRRRSDGVYYYRVRAERNGELGPWSNTQHLVSIPRQVWTVEPPEDYKNGDLLAVQRALLRFCAARGDLLAVLSLPNHYREDEALAHVATLTPHAGGEVEKAAASRKVRVMPLTWGEERALSFGALYHPWIATRVEQGRGATAVRLVPPGGAVCGTIAARAIARGAWVAPANEPLRDVVSLDPAIGRQGWESLFEAQVNVIRQDPRGFLLLSADTLSTEIALRPINVRRLLVLLRRLALREGMTYVFQPNDEDFRSLVQHRFEQLLADLYTRGAFAGDTPTTAYQVVADHSVNTPASLEQGRFIVELRVAPSQPMAFITVRLVQTGQEGLVIQEV